MSWMCTSSNGKTFKDEMFFFGLGRNCGGFALSTEKCVATGWGNKTEKRWTNEKRHGFNGNHR